MWFQWLTLILVAAVDMTTSTSSKSVATNGLLPITTAYLTTMNKSMSQPFPSSSAAANISVTGSRGSPFSKVTTTSAYKTAISEIIDMNNTLVFRNLSTPPPLSSGYPSHFITEQAVDITTSTSSKSVAINSLLNVLITTAYLTTMNTSTSQSFPSSSVAANISVTGSRGSPFSKVTNTSAYRTATSEARHHTSASSLHPHTPTPSVVFRNLSTPPPLSSGYPSHIFTEQAAADGGQQNIYIAIIIAVTVVIVSVTLIVSVTVIVVVYRIKGTSPYTKDEYISTSGNFCKGNKHFISNGVYEMLQANRDESDYEPDPCYILVQ